MKHVLLDKMFIYPVRPQNSTLNDFEYDDIKGYWRNKATQSPLILDKAAAGLRTKKEDLETGEDKKGE